MFLQKTDKPADKKLVMIAAKDILPSGSQPRKSYDEYDLWKLTASIRESGILQPLSVRACGDKYELICGHRRLKAAVMAGMKEVPCIIHEVSGEDAAVLTVTENLQRCDLTAFEEADAILSLIERYGFTQSTVAAKLGIAQSTLANKLRLLKLTAEQREKIEKAGLSERHARAIVRIEDASKRDELLNTVIAKGLNVQKTEELAEKMLNPKAGATDLRPVRTCAVGDIRLFINSLNKLVGTLEESGIAARLDKKETAEYTEYTVRVQKQGHPLRLV